MKKKLRWMTIKVPLFKFKPATVAQQLTHLVKVAKLATTGYVPQDVYEDMGKEDPKWINEVVEINNMCLDILIAAAYRLKRKVTK